MICIFLWSNYFDLPLDLVVDASEDDELVPFACSGLVCMGFSLFISSSNLEAGTVRAFVRQPTSLVLMPQKDIHVAPFRELGQGGQFSNKNPVPLEDFFQFAFATLCHHAWKIHMIAFRNYPMWFQPWSPLRFWNSLHSFMERGSSPAWLVRSFYVKRKLEL